MIKIFKKKIKSIRPFYSALVWLHKIFVAVQSVRLDISSLREFVVWAKGGQELGENNYRFYENFANGIVLRASHQFHFIDVGANDGWFARTIFRFAPNVRITSYEPLLSQHPSLESLERKYPNFHFRKKAVGDRGGSLTITEYATSGLSSLKEISSTYEYSDHYSQSVVNQYSVEIVRLDDELADIIAGQENIDLVLKVDTQGYELEVLKGAENCLRKGFFKYIIIELMTVEKYAGGHLYDEIFGFLHNHDYKLWDLNTTYYEPVFRRLTEFDVVFVWNDSNNGRVNGQPK